MGLYLQQSRILKHAGDLEAAAAMADEARRLDLADRYINSECVKRMLQADQVKSSDIKSSLFLREKGNMLLAFFNAILILSF